MRYSPFRVHSDLPEIGQGVESETLDLKGRLANKPVFYIAKRIAAFANHLGGTLLIGAAEELGRVKTYDPLAEDEIAATEEAIQRAVRDRCYPSPICDVVRIPHQPGLLLAVNVFPSVDLIAVRVRADKKQEGYGDYAFVFPKRVGSHTADIPIEKVALHMIPEVRRIAILLAAIPEGVKVTIQGPGAAQQRAVHFRSLDESRNTVTFSSSGSPKPDVIPLDMIRSVYEHADGWRVVLSQWM